MKFSQLVLLRVETASAPRVDKIIVIESISTKVVNSTLMYFYFIILYPNRCSVHERLWLQTLVREVNQPNLTRCLWTPPMPMLSLRYEITIS